MDTKLYNFKTINYDNTKSFLANELKSNGIMEETVALICAYVIVKHNRTENSDISSFESFIETTCLDDDIKDSITLSLNGKWNVILNAKSECPIDQLMAMLLFDDSFYEISKIIGTTPECITELSSYLLKRIIWSTNTVWTGGLPTPGSICISFRCGFYPQVMHGTDLHLHTRCPVRSMLFCQ